MCCLCVPVHPRVCGEHGGANLSQAGLGGSSPRVRGTLRKPPVEQDDFRFIPACAGNTSAADGVAGTEGVHPRVCGEHNRLNEPPLPSNGSSPRVRGTLSAAFWVAAASRFIPACAGNTSTPRPRSARRSVHPRVCGEHACPRRKCPTCTGSSPRVRGTRMRPCGARGYHRFIPACAGNTAAPHAPSDALPVHPRVCGEHELPHVAAHATIGSSPRVRGTLLAQRRDRLAGRFIPACAGNTTPTPTPTTTKTVHPRVCGEHR